MAITPVAESSGTSADGTSTSFATSWKSGFSPLANDLAIVSVHFGGNSLTASLAGWSAFTGISNPQTQGTNSRCYVWYKVLSAGESPPTVSLSGFATGGWTLQVYRGVDTSAPYNQASVNLGTGTSLALPSLTGVEANAMLHAVAQARVAPGGTIPTGLNWNVAYTEATESITSRPTASQNVAVSNAYRSISAAGSYGGESVTVANSVSCSIINAMIELNPLITETNLTVADASHSHGADNVTLTQTSNLVVADAGQSQAADNLTLTQAHKLVVADATSAHSADNVALTQVHELTVADAAQGQAAETLSLTQAHVLSVANVSSGATSDSPTLTQQHVLVVQDALQAHSAEVPELSLTTMLVVPDSRQSHTAENVDLTQEHNLAVADARQLMGSNGTVLLRQQHFLTVQDATQGQTTENVDLVQVPTLVVADSALAISSDTPSLTQEHNLAVDDAAQELTSDLVDVEHIVVGEVFPNKARHTIKSDVVVIKQQHFLTVADAEHDQAAAPVTLTQVHSLTVPRSILVQSADNVILTQLHKLVVQEARQTLGSDSVATVQNSTLVVADSRHEQSADSGLALGVNLNAVVFITVAAYGPVTTTIAADGPVTAVAPRTSEV